MSQNSIAMKHKSDITKTSVIRLTVGLDEKNMPRQLEWQADDPGGKGQASDCKAFLLSVFDRNTLETLKIDLWTTDMQVNEMDKFMFQTLRALTDTYFKATQNKELANDMQRFVLYFGEKTGILKKE